MRRRVGYAMGILLGVIIGSQPVLAWQLHQLDLNIYSLAAVVDAGTAAIALALVLWTILRSPRPRSSP